MQRKNVFEKVMEEIIKRTDKLSSLMTMDFVEKKPFDQPEITPKEQFYYYKTQFTPEMEQMGRQQMGNDIVNQYIESMEKIGGRYNA